MTGTDDTAALFEEVTADMDFGVGTVLDGDQMMDLIEELLRERSHPDYETVMVAKQGPPRTHYGVAGFREALTDWLSPWEEFRFEIEEIVPIDDLIVMMVRQTGTTKHGGVEITTESGTVWWIQDGQVRRATFYLDRNTARKAAGIG